MKKKKVLSVLLFFVWTFFLLAAPQEEVLVKFKSDVSIEKRNSILKSLGIRSKKEMRQLNIVVCELPSTFSINSVQQNAANFSEIEYVEPNVTYHALQQQDQAKIQSKLPFKLEKLDKFDQKTYSSGEIIIKFKLSATENQIKQFSQVQNFKDGKYIERLGIHLCTFSESRGLKDAVVACAVSDIVEYVEPNFIVHIFETPNDPRLKDQWGLSNSKDADIDAPEAWDIQTGDPNVLVGIIDTGIDYNHEDLKENYWYNPGEMGDGKRDNGIDDDNNGYVDDWRGWDFKGNDNNPMDDNGHGTHCAGIAAALGNNGKGGSGVAWKASLVGLKFLGMTGSGTVADAAEAIIYAADMNIRILSNSWGGTEYSRTLEDAVKYAAGRSVLFVAAAGNSKSDNDFSPHYPSNLEVENVISVAASDDRDRRADFSNYGEKSVDLAAPGDGIWSTHLHNKYEILSGTSMATPFVSGAAALLLSEFPGITLNQMKIRIFGGVDRKSDWEDIVATGGRLNAAKSLSHSPIFAFTTEYNTTKDIAGPYKIRSNVTDDDSVSDVKLIYYFNNSSRRDTLMMESLGDDKYQAGIPGQPFGTTVSYYLIAEDSEDNRTQSRIFSFKVTESGNGCCGGAALSLAPGNHKQMFAGVIVFSNLLLVIIPWSIFRRVYRKKE